MCPGIYLYLFARYSIFFCFCKRINFCWNDILIYVQEVVRYFPLLIEIVVLLILIDSDNLFSDKNYLSNFRNSFSVLVNCLFMVNDHWSLN